MLLKRLFWTFYINVIAKINRYSILSRSLDIVNLLIKYQIENEFLKKSRWLNVIVIHEIIH